jgi:hypothetical protein
MRGTVGAWGMPKRLAGLLRHLRPALQLLGTGLRVRKRTNGNSTGRHIGRQQNTCSGHLGRHKPHGTGFCHRFKKPLTAPHHHREYPEQGLERARGDVFLRGIAPRANPWAGSASGPPGACKTPSSDTKVDAMSFLTLALPLTSAAPCRFNGGDIDFPHLHHGLKRTFGHSGIGVCDGLH